MCVWICVCMCACGCMYVHAYGVLGYVYECVGEGACTFSNSGVKLCMTQSQHSTINTLQFKGHKHRLHTKRACFSNVVTTNCKHYTSEALHKRTQTHLSHGQFQDDLHQLCRQRKLTHLPHDLLGLHSWTGQLVVIKMSKIYQRLQMLKSSSGGLKVKGFLNLTPQRVSQPLCDCFQQPLSNMNY